MSGCEKLLIGVLLSLAIRAVGQTSGPGPADTTQHDKPTASSLAVGANDKADQDEARGFLPPGTDPENKLMMPFIRHMASDQMQFWTSPRDLGKPGTLKTFVPFVGFTGLLIASDSWMAKQVPDKPNQLKRSKSISNYAVFSLIGTAGAAYAFGHLTHNDHMSEAGFLSGEAALNSTLVAYAFKEVARRERPYQGNGNGTFFRGGTSFPSEHATVAWSVASVLAHEYPGPLTQLAAYGLASAVTLTRVTGKQHFPSDVVIGSALGWYFGREVYRAHHDPELGGAPWGNFLESSDEKGPRNLDRMGSPYVPLDSWVYPALEKLAALGYTRSAFAGLKPWTRIECAQLTEEVGETVALREGSNKDAVELQAKLQKEFSYEFDLLAGRRNLNAAVDSVYARSVSISGSELTDSYHLGQTLSYDFGRPSRRGMNQQVGGSVSAEAGPFALSVRAEFQHSPSAPELSDAVRNIIAVRDLVPVPAAVPFETINRPRLLDAYVTANFGGWQISGGKQSLSWGPGLGGSLLWSNNVEPVNMIRVVKGELRLPSILRFLGPARVDQFAGRLDGGTFVPHPYVYGQKINFKPFSFLEVGFGRSVTLGGKGGTPLTAGNLIHSLFGQTDRTGSVPGDSHSGMDWTFYVPKVKNYIVFYGEVYADDDFFAWQNPAKNPYRPGIYITRIPWASKLDFHMEAASTESPGFFNFGGTNRGDLNYWNQTYRDGYTNNGNLIGNTVGRMGRTIQAWSTYWISSRSTLQLVYKHNSVSSDFIPGGGAWQDYGLRNETYLRSGLYVKSALQYERISRYPILFKGTQRNVSAIVEMGFSPHFGK